MLYTLFIPKCNFYLWKFKVWPKNAEIKTFPSKVRTGTNLVWCGEFYCCFPISITSGNFKALYLFEYCSKIKCYTSKSKFIVSEYNDITSKVKCNFLFTFNVTFLFPIAIFTCKSLRFDLKLLQLKHFHLKWQLGPILFDVLSFIVVFQFLKLLAISNPCIFLNIAHKIKCYTWKCKFSIYTWKNSFCKFYTTLNQTVFFLGGGAPRIIQFKVKVETVWNLKF